MDHMQPLSEFVKHHVKSEWRTEKEFILNNHAHTRFRILVEHSEMTSLSDGFVGVWRHEKLEEAGINAACEDAKEFAKELLDTLFYHLSPHETMHIIKVLQDDLDKWHKERMEVYASRPEIFGHPPSEADKYCPY